MNGGLSRIFLVCAAYFVTMAPSVSGQEIPRDEYIRMMPLSLPRLVRQNAASVDLNLYGDRDAPGYVDADPVDGIDDARGRVLLDLASRFAPYLVQNTTNVPLNFDIFIENRDDFQLTIDTWETAGVEAHLADSASVNMSILGEATCQNGQRGETLRAVPLAGMDPAIEDCKILDLMERYTPGAGLTSSRDESLIRSDPSPFDVLYFNFPGDGERTWSEAYEPEWDRTPEDRRPSFMHSYVHPFLIELEDGGYEVVLQYWFFYPTNDSGMDHEGDWEHINVAVSPRSMVEAGLSPEVVGDILDGSRDTSADAEDPLVIKRVDYYFHELVWPLDFSSPNVYLPRDEWQAQADALPRDRYRQEQTFEAIRYMAYADDAETIINTHPLGYIGADNKGLNQALKPPGGSNQEPHGTYPFPGRYNNIGPGGTTDQVARQVDIREHLADVAAGRIPDDPTFENRAVIGLSQPERLRIVPDWERVVDLARADTGVRRDWAWLLLPVRWGYPATRSPFAGALEHYNTGNVAPQGPSFNAGWNATGASAAFSIYEPHSLPSLFPLQIQDNFRNDLGFLNLTVPLFLNLPPLDFLARLVSYPFKRAFGQQDPVYYPRDGLPFRFVGLSSGVAVSKGDDNFGVLTLNAAQREEFVVDLILHLVQNGANDETVATSAEQYTSDPVGPFYQVAFYVGNHVVSENTVRNIRSDLGLDFAFSNIPSYSYHADVNYWEYAGSLRYNILTEALQPFVKGGYGWSWYRLENVTSNGELFTPAASDWFKPDWWPNVWHYGLGVEWVPWRRVGVDGGGLEVALRLEYVRSQQTLRVDFDDVLLSDLQLIFSRLGDVPTETGVHRNDFVIGLSITF